MEWVTTQMRFLKNEEREYECLKKCLENLGLRERKIVLTLGACGENDKATIIRHRSELAAKLGITDNDLRVEALRIRGKLQECLRKCLSED